MPEDQLDVALIGAIVAEFFGSPIWARFRISAEVARLTSTSSGGDCDGGAGRIASMARSAGWSACSPFGIRRTAIQAADEQSREKAMKRLGLPSRRRSRSGRLGRGAGQGDAAIEMGDAAAIRRLLRRQGQGLL